MKFEKYFPNTANEVASTDNQRIIEVIQSGEALPTPAAIASNVDFMLAFIDQIPNMSAEQRKEFAQNIKSDFEEVCAQATMAVGHMIAEQERIDLKTTYGKLLLAVDFLEFIVTLGADFGGDELKVAEARKSVRDRLELVLNALETADDYSAK